ncbi:MAG: hypothetical protein IPP33_03720 [Flavobacteriales bacterium]|nr:hypothetical protein [Flavobacteriales bacterium]
MPKTGGMFRSPPMMRTARRGWRTMTVWISHRTSSVVNHLTVVANYRRNSPALALGKVYTFGPAFRAENNSATRHPGRFWIIERVRVHGPALATWIMAEGLCKHLMSRVLKNSMDDTQFLDARLREEEATKPRGQRAEDGASSDKAKFVLENHSSGCFSAVR